MYSALALMEDSPRGPPFCLDILDPYKCQYCRFTTDFKVDFYVHLRTVHERKQINCNLHQIFECSKCKNCNFNTHSILLLQTHVNNCDYERTFKKRLESATLKFKCEQCNFKTNLESDFKEHMTVGHNGKLKKMSYPPKLVSPDLIEKNKDIQSRENRLKSPKFLLVFKKNDEISNRPKLVSAGLLEKSKNHIICSPGSSVLFSENAGNIQGKKNDCSIVPQTYKCKQCVFKHCEKIVMKNPTSVYRKGKRFDLDSNRPFGYYKCEKCYFYTDAASVMLKYKRFSYKQLPFDPKTGKHLLDHTYSLKQENAMQVKKPKILTNEAFEQLNPYLCPRCNFKALLTDVGFKKLNFYRCPRCYFEAQPGGPGSLIASKLMLRPRLRPRFRPYEVITPLKCKLCLYQCDYNHQLRDHIVVTHTYLPSTQQQESTLKIVD